MHEEWRLKMGKSTFIRKIRMECPLCDKIHEVEECSLSN